MLQHPPPWHIDAAGGGVHPIAYDIPTAWIRHEWLDLHIFETIEEAQQIATDWLWTYNNERPNMGIGGITPAQKLMMAA